MSHVVKEMVLHLRDVAEGVSFTEMACAIMESVMPPVCGVV